MTSEPFEKRFLELYTVVADAHSFEEARRRLAAYSAERLGAAQVKALIDEDPPRNADDVFSLAEPGAEQPWLHLVVSWGRQRRPADSVLRSFRGSLALLMPFLAQRRRLDLATRHLEGASPPELTRMQTELEEPELRRLLHKLVERALQEVGGTHGAVLLVDPVSDGLRLETTAYVGPLTLDPKTLPRLLRRRSDVQKSTGSERRHRPSTSGLWFHVLDARRPYRSGSVLDDPRYLPLFRDSRSNLTIPLLLGGSAVGTLVVESSERNAFTAADEEKLRMFAESAAALIAKTRAYEETRALGPSNTLRLFGLSSETLSRAHQAAAVDAPFHVQGETGTGKEMLARYIHRLGSRAGGPFVVSGDPAALREGDLTRASGGTLFVDDADRLPQTAQEGLSALVGSPQPFRLVVATSGGPLVEPLGRTLARNTIVLPPLRLHPDAIVSLAKMILREVCENRGIAAKWLAAPSMEALLRYPFPGNLRELREVIETAAAAAEGPVVQPFHLPPKLLARPETGRTGTYQSMQEETERAYLSDLLLRARGDLARASSLAGLDPAKLQQLLKKHALKASDFLESQPAARKK